MSSPKATNKIAFYLGRMASRGFKAEQVLAGSGLDEERVYGDAFRHDPNQYRVIIHNIIRLTRNPFIGIELGSEFKISDLGVFGYAVLSAANLEQSREIYSRYDSALNDHIISTSNHMGDGQWYSELTETFPLGDILPFAVEEFVSQTIELASSLTNKPFPILELRLSYPQPDDLTAYKERFKCPMSFDQPHNLVFFDINHINDPISLANESVFKLCEQQCQLLASELDGDSPLSSKIRNTLVEKPGEFPTLEVMAKRLNMGSRTLRRRLVKEDLTYQRILDDTRRDLAIQYLEHTSLPPKKIGYLLGYNCVNNFRRAFKGWTGKKTSDFRPKT